MGVRDRVAVDMIGDGGYEHVDVLRQRDHLVRELQRLGDERDLANVEGYVNKVRGRARDFPGAVEGKERVARTVAYDANLVHRWDTTNGGAPNLYTSPDVWQETGLYAAPGEVVVVKVASLPEHRTVKVIVGCHRDSLLKLPKWNRFPVIARTFELKVGENKIANAFGGQLFIQSSNKDWRKPMKASPARSSRRCRSISARVCPVVSGWTGRFRKPLNWA